METDNLTKDSIFKLIKNIAIPASTGLIFNTFYNVVDTYFAGKEIGTAALAGITIGFPIYFILIAISTGIGNGTTALASIALGRKDRETYHSLALNSMVIGFVSSLLIALSIKNLVPFLFKFSGASGTELNYGIDYINTIFIGSIFFIINSILNALLVAYGDTKSYRNFLIIGFFLNILLDPLFIMGWFGLPKLETIGVALATVLVQMTGTIYLGKRLYQNHIFKFELFKRCNLRLKTILELLEQGIPSALTTATTALGVFVINYFILKIMPGPVTIAAYGAAMRVEQLALIPTMGLNTAAITISGQNFGGKIYSRVIEVKNKTLLIGTTFITLGGIIIYPFISSLIGIFASDINVINAGTHYLQIEILALPTYIILGLYLSVLQGIKKPNWAVFIGTFRQIIMPFVLFNIFTKVFNMGITGIWIGVVIVNWLAVILTYFYGEYTLKRILLLGDEK